MNPLPTHVAVPVELPEALLARPCVLATLARLLSEYDCAGFLNASVWDFALDRDGLERIGLTGEDLQTLIDAGYVEDHITVERSRLRGRTHQPAELTTPRTLFVLTAAGALRARALLYGLLPPAAPAERNDPARPTEGVEGKPRWDAHFRTLWFRGQLVKRFKRSAPNQECLLAVFEEDGWPDCLADPLPQDAEVDPVQRLRDTVKSLNRILRCCGLHFAVDTTGTQVRWEAVD